MKQHRSHADWGLQQCVSFMHQPLDSGDSAGVCADMYIHPPGSSILCSAREHQVIFAGAGEQRHSRL